MNTQDNDEIPAAFQLLRSSVDLDSEPNLDLEQRLMTELSNGAKRSQARKFAWLLGLTLFGLTASTVFASGGADAIARWFGIAVTEDGTLEPVEIHGALIPADDGQLILLRPEDGISSEQAFGTSELKIDANSGLGNNLIIESGKLYFPNGAPVPLQGHHKQ